MSRTPFFVFFLAASIGLSLGLIKATNDLRAEGEEHLIQINPAKIQNQIGLAINTIINCPYLRINHPLAARQLENIIKESGGLSFFYDPQLPLHFYAFASPPDAIVLGTAFMSEPEFNQEQIIAHEILHLAGLPPHRTLPGKDYPDRSVDQIYVAIAHCYSGVAFQ